MRQPLLAAMTLTLVLGGCGGFSARLNPFNWFGGSEEVAVVPLVTEGGIVADPRPLAQQVTFLAVEPLQGGAIVRATGLPPTQGHYNAELVARPLDDAGVLVFDFHLVPPRGATDVNTPRSREVQVATFVSDFDLANVRQITVQAATNARSSRR